MITMVLMFVAAGIDEMLVLIVFFAHANNAKQIKQVYVGQQVGMTSVLIVSLLALYGISFINGEWTGLLGLLPIVIGVMALFERDEEEEDNALLSKSSIFSNLSVRVAIIAIAGGAEEIAVIVPYFTTLTMIDLFLAAVTFFVMVLIWSIICHVLSSTKQVYAFVNKYERIFIPVVFIWIGIHVLLESDTIETILDLFL